jgi:hypothetical protein
VTLLLLLLWLLGGGHWLLSCGFGRPCRRLDGWSLLLLLLLWLRLRSCYSSRLGCGVHRLDGRSLLPSARRLHLFGWRVIHAHVGIDGR